MEWIRDWIMQVAGIIVLGSVCDVIMPESDMKKYVRLIVGLVLVFAVIKPIVNFSADKIEVLDVREKQEQASDFWQKLDEKEKEQTIKIYKDKLCQSILNELKESDQNAEISVEVDEENKEKFGEIVHVTVKINNKESPDSTDQIKRKISRTFGVGKEKITVVFKSQQTDQRTKKSEFKE